MRTVLLVLTASVSVAIAEPTQAQTLVGLTLGDPEAVALAVLGPSIERKPVSLRPGASALRKDNLSVTICNGVVSGIRASRNSSLVDYAREVDLEGKRQGLAQSLVSYGEVGTMRTVLVTTRWTGVGFATQLDLSTVASESQSATLLSRDYASDPNPCPRASK